jgi:hypothetical protein
LDSSVIASPTGRARPLHWDGDAVSMTSGVTTTAARTEDRLEEIWRRRYAGVFNPARLKAMPTGRGMNAAQANHNRRRETAHAVQHCTQ